MDSARQVKALLLGEFMSVGPWISGWNGWLGKKGAVEARGVRRKNLPERRALGK